MRLRAAPLAPHPVVVDGGVVSLEETSTAYAVWVDGQPVRTIEVSSAEERYELARDLDPKVPHDVRVAREAEAFAGVHELVGIDLGAGGTFLPPPAHAYRLAFVGDSIMCGYGILGADAKCPFTFATERASLAYPAVVARALDAEVTTTCWSGRGVYRNYDGSKNGTMPELFGLALPAPKTAPWSFANDVVDAVVVGLGTNDFLGGGGQPPDVTQLVDTYVRFLRRLREIHPAALVVVATSPMLGGAGGARDVARRAFDTVVVKRRAEGDTHVELFDLAYQGADVGCDAHPNVKKHRELAASLEAFLRPRLPRRPR